MTYELSRWDPVLMALQDDMNRLVGDVWRGSRRTTEPMVWLPPVDVEETKDEVVVKAELPGLSREDIKIQAHGDTLTITGERRQDAETKDKTVHMVERVYGKFQRMMTLPAEVEGGRATATYDQGVLTIRLPKAEHAKPKEISIAVR